MCIHSASDRPIRYASPTPELMTSLGESGIPIGVRSAGGLFSEAELSDAAIVFDMMNDEGLVAQLVFDPALGKLLKAQGMGLTPAIEAEQRAIMTRLLAAT